jgi:Na+-transporting NADH:ubiquinone oxidoreductase subunit NqrE
MNSLVLTSLLPVILLICAGFAAARLGWVRDYPLLEHVIYINRLVRDLSYQ